MDNSTQLVNEITYLASLASNAREVDPMLDTLRLVTAKQAKEGPLILSNDDANRLITLRGQLVDYLTGHDPVRTFTTTSLEQRVAQHFNASDTRVSRGNNVRREVLTIFLISLAAYLLAFVLLHGTRAVRSTLAAPAFMLGLNVGLAWLFWSARRELVAQMQRAYMFLAAAIIVSAITSIQYPIFSAYPKLTHHALIQYSGFMMPYPVMYFLFFWAFYLFARQLPGVKTRAFRPIITLPVGILLAGVILILPHPTPVPSELYYKLALSAVAVGVYFSALGGILAFAVARRMTARYVRPIVLLAIAQVIFTITSLAIAALMYIKGPVSPLDTKITALSTPFIISLLCQLAAGYLFKRNLED